MTIAAFLLARYAEEAGYVDAAITSDGLGMLRSEDPAGFVADVRDLNWRLGDLTAKRQIVELHWMAGGSTTSNGRDWHRWRYCNECQRPDDDDVPDIQYPCPTLRALAQPYADHPDFDPAWLPDTPNDRPGA